MGIIKLSVRWGAALLVLYVVILLIEGDVEAAQKMVAVIDTLVPSTSGIPGRFIPLILLLLGMGILAYKAY